MAGFIGNRETIERARALFANSPCNAIFFSKIKGLGKFTIAKELLLDYPDVLSINGDGFDVEACCGLLEKLSIVPAGNKKRIVLVDNASDISVTVQNKLLKVVEDEQEHNVFLFIAHRPLLPTLMSRCMTFTFQPLNDDEVSGFLSEQGVADEKREFFRLLMNGSIGTYYHVKSDDSLCSLLYSVYELYVSGKVSSAVLLRKFSLEHEKSAAFEKLEPELDIILSFLSNLWFEICQGVYGLKRTRFLAFQNLTIAKADLIHEILLTSFDLHEKGLFTRQEMFRLINMMGGQ